MTQRAAARSEAPRESGGHRFAIAGRSLDGLAGTPRTYWLAGNPARRTENPVLIRPARPDDHEAIWRILEPTIRAGETYALPQGMAEAEAIAYWAGPDRETLVCEAHGRLLGTYYLRANQLGGGAHVANCGYVVASDATGRGVARRMREHSVGLARERGFRAMQFNLVVGTNERAIRLWQSLGFETVGRLPGAFRHPRLGYVDALVMFLTL